MGGRAVLLYGHRGAKGEAPENTEPAGVPRFQEALDASSGLRWIVITVQPDAPTRLRQACERLAGWVETLDELQRAERLGCLQIAVPVATGSEWLVQAAHVLGIEVIGWLANTSNEVNAFLAWGVDAIVSDYPSVAKHILTGR